MRKSTEKKSKNQNLTKNYKKILIEDKKKLMTE